MDLWDVFHSDRLEAERSLTTEDVRAALARGDLVEDDLIRPAGSARWARLGDAPEFADVGPPPIGEDDPAEFEFEFDPEADEPSDRAALAPAGAEDGPMAEAEAEAAFPVLPDEESAQPDLPELDGPDPGEFDPQDEDEEAAEFTLSRHSADRVEELDLAAMVDVAFQLVLFFLVTTTAVVFKTLEVPRPNEDKPPEAAAQARNRTIEELEKDYILVEVDAAGSVKVDRQPAPADRAALAGRLRAAREDGNHRKAMLLSADFATPHKNAVLVFDVANEVELQIAIAQPAAKK